MKKRLIIVALLLATLFLCVACTSGSGASETKTSEAAFVPQTDTVPVILSQAEYVLYQNVFYNDYGTQLEGKTVEKNGVFTTIRDEWNKVDRYYVWGYLDNTLCCDWQWEIQIRDTSKIPSNGSSVVVKGTFSASDDSLDGYWITDPSIQVTNRYTGPVAELNMCTMSGTLERVQIMNILYRGELLEGKTLTAYGRIAGNGVLQDPYYDGSWQIPFTSEADMPAIGTDVVLSGKVVNSALGDCTMEIKQ